MHHFPVSHSHTLLLILSKYSYIDVYRGKKHENLKAKKREENENSSDGFQYSMNLYSFYNSLSHSLYGLLFAARATHSHIMCSVFCVYAYVFSLSLFSTVITVRHFSFEFIYTINKRMKKTPTGKRCRDAKQ